MIIDSNDSLNFFKLKILFDLIDELRQAEIVLRAQMKVSSVGMITEAFFYGIFNRFLKSSPI